MLINQTLPLAHPYWCACGAERYCFRINAFLGARLSGLYDWLPRLDGSQHWNKVSLDQDCRLVQKIDPMNTALIGLAFNERGIVMKGERLRRHSYQRRTRTLSECFPLPHSAFSYRLRLSERERAARFSSVRHVALRGACIRPFFPQPFISDVNPPRRVVSVRPYILVTRAHDFLWL